MVAKLYASVPTAFSVETQKNVRFIAERKDGKSVMFKFSTKNAALRCWLALSRSGQYQRYSAWYAR